MTQAGDGAGGARDQDLHHPAGGARRARARASGRRLDIGELRPRPRPIADLLAPVSSTSAPIVEELAGVPGAVVSGRGIAYATALELALKLKEACYLHAMGLSYADLLHGPIAVVDDDTPAIVVAADSGPTLAGTRRAGPAGDRRGREGVRHRRRRRRSPRRAPGALPGTALPEWVAPIGLIVPGQLLTEALARNLGIDPDNPRGLCKVTQTD